MNGLLILIVAALLLGAAYFFYGRYLERLWGIDPQKKTPAYELEDGVDYVPTPPGVVFGHEFASIAGAGPINGPIIAASFGWLPVLLWVILGGVFFGAVQDFAAMYGSVKNKGKTIGYIIEVYIGKTGKQVFLLFVWLFSILAVAAFVDIVAVTFTGVGGDGVRNSANASVAATSMLFIIAAVFLGFFIRKIRYSGIITGFIAAALLAACIALGLGFPLFLSKSFWRCLVFGYVFVASVTPVWVLLQPRDYLNSFLLVAMILAAFIGILVSAPVINLPAFTSFTVNGSSLFPMLFITVACGAISGIHSLIASGTASKQVENERHILPISFGAMLVESFLAVISLIAVGALAVGGTLPQGTPPQIFAAAVAGFLTTLGLPEEVVFTLVTLAISAFALTSLDSGVRVGRLAFQELWTDEAGGVSGPAKGLANKFVATFLTLFLSYLLTIVGYENIWPLFGSANQMLAALGLISCAVFLKKTNRKGVMLYAPAAVMLGVTFTALFFTIRNKSAAFLSGGFSWNADGLQLVFAVLLLILGFMVAVSGVKKLVSHE
ncbi:MAG: carbon starvation protein A [Treponema sp.]|jgi:carbon starvation protein|nr:carbon starvation protein A [Treponema sp.]